MKNLISNFSGSILSRDQMKRVKGAVGDDEAKCSESCSKKGSCSPSPSGNKSCECTTDGGGTCTYS